MKTLELKVTGLKCVHCEAGVAKALEQVDGVEKAIADRTNDRVLIRIAGDAVEADALKAAVEDAGFAFEGIVG